MVSSLQRDQTDALHEVQKWTTKECQMKPNCLAVGSCCSLDKARLRSTLPRAKAAVTWLSPCLSGCGTDGHHVLAPKKARS